VYILIHFVGAAVAYEMVSECLEIS